MYRQDFLQGESSEGYFPQEHEELSLKQLEYYEHLLKELAEKQNPQE